MMKIKQIIVQFYVTYVKNNLRTILGDTFLPLVLLQSFHINLHTGSTGKKKNKEKGAQMK